jgi:hypothetical protein
MEVDQAMMEQIVVALLVFSLAGASIMLTEVKKRK